MNEKDRNSTRWKPTPEDAILMSIEGISFLAQVVLCVLFYNSLDLRWLLYLGWAIFAAAMVLGWRARVAFETRGGSREGESWLHTRTVVATGIYAVVRHPMYLSFLLMSLSLVLLSQHWLNATLGASSSVDSCADCAIMELALNIGPPTFLQPRRTSKR